MTNEIIHIINAESKKLGRVASEAANFLMGKRTVDFVRNKVSGVKVSIINIKKLDIDVKKMDNKEYVTFTGFRGGINTEKLSNLIARKGINEIMERAVYRMLPSNSLRKQIMKNLAITE